MKIFGDKKRGYKPDNDRISATLDKFLEEFPDGKCNSGEKRCPGGWLSKFMKSVGNRKTEGNVEDRPALDWGLYYTRVKASRPRWTEHEISKVWTDADRQCLPHERKHTPAGDTRIPIPTWVFGDEVCTKRNENYEDQYHQNDKGSVTHDEATQLLKETQYGNGAMPSGVPSASTGPTGLAPAAPPQQPNIPTPPKPGVSPSAAGSPTPKKAARPRNLLSEVFADAPVEESQIPAGAVAASPDGKAAAASDADGEKPAKKRRIDIGVKRSQVMNTEKKALTIKKVKADKILDEAALEIFTAIKVGVHLDSTDLVMTKSRWECLLAWMGRKPKMVPILPEPATEPKTQIQFVTELAAGQARKCDSVVLDVAAARNGFGDAIKASFHSDESVNDKVLQDLISTLEVKPVKAEDAISFVTLEMQLQKIATAQSEEDIEKLVRTIHDGASLLIEFAEAVQGSRRELKRAHTQITSDIASNKRKLEEQQMTKFNKESSETVQHLRRKNRRCSTASCSLWIGPLLDIPRLRSS